LIQPVRKTVANHGAADTKEARIENRNTSRAIRRFTGRRDPKSNQNAIKAHIAMTNIAHLIRVVNGAFHAATANSRLIGTWLNKSQAIGELAQMSVRNDDDTTGSIASAGGMWFTDGTIAFIASRKPANQGQSTIPVCANPMQANPQTTQIPQTKVGPCAFKTGFRDKPRFSLSSLTMSSSMLHSPAPRHA